MPAQPTLPPEGAFSEIERLIISESPPGLWPENQNSNFGALRKVISARAQEIADDTDELFNEMFVQTSSIHLSRHESEVGIPYNLADPIAQRRSDVLSRLRKEPFTDARIRSLIESYITPLFGSSPQFLVEGIPLVAAGVPLYADTAAPETLYRIYYDPVNFSYSVWLVNTVSPSSGLLRELQLITPAGITVAYDNTKTNILDYQRTILSDRPSFYWPLATSSGTGAPWQSIAGIPNVLTISGGSPTNTGGLIQNSGGVVGDTQSRNFNGTTDVLTSPYNNNATAFGDGAYSIEAWLRPSVLPGVGVSMNAISLGGDNWAGAGRLGIENPTGAVAWNFYAAYSDVGGSAVLWATTPAPVAGIAAHVVGTWTGRRVRLYVNGVKVGDQDMGPNYKIRSPFIAAPISIGRYYHAAANWWNGVIDEPAIYGYALSEAQILRHYKTGINVL